MKLQDRIETIGSLDAGIHNPARLMIVLLLAGGKTLDYVSLMRQTGLSSGNISTHLNKLLELGYISMNKSFVGRKPNTAVELTPTGKDAYLRWGEGILQALPEQTTNRLCASLLSSVMGQKNRAFPVLEWYPYMLGSQPHLLMRDYNRRCISMPPMQMEGQF